MLYSDYILKAKAATIEQADNNEWYLEPEWKDILYHNGLGDIENLTESHLDGWNDVEDILKLEVIKRNAIASNKNIVIDWVYELITSTVEPAVMKEETDYIESVVKFMKQNHERQGNTN